MNRTQLLTTADLTREEVDFLIKEAEVMRKKGRTDDLKGKVIGKEGAIANAIRVVLRSAGKLQDVKASMKIDSGTEYKVPDESR